MSLRRTFRLPVHKRVIVFFRENGGCDLAAEVAVDAGVIDKKVTCDILRVGSLEIGHI
jgi:hypothetical protein